MVDAVTCAGLGYGSGSETDDDDERDDDNTPLTGRRSPAAESSDDEEVQARIRRKKVEFERKMLELEQQADDDGKHAVSCVCCG